MSDNLSARAVRPLQLICIALILGLVLFCTVALFLSLSGVVQPDAGAELVTWILLGLSLPQIMATQVVAGRLLPVGKSDPESLVARYRTSSIVAWAGLEGAAFMNIVGLLLSGNLVALIVPGVALCWIAVTFPTADGLDNWLRQRQLEHG
jgi:hypothetical protein